MVKKTNILIIGAGKGGTALVEILRNSKTVNIVGVVDADLNAPGIKLAKELRIPVGTDYKGFINNEELEEIINVTGSNKIQEELIKVKPASVEVIDGRSAKLVWELISEYREAQEEIKHVAAGWKRTFEGITDLIFIQDNQHTILEVNTAFAEALKSSPEDIIGLKCYELLHKMDKPWPGCPFEMTKKDKKAHVEEVDDPEIGTPLLVTTSPIFDENGELFGSVHIAKDISVLKKTEKELKKKIRDLEVFNKIAVGRELKMAELKKRVNELEEKLKGE